MKQDVTKLQERLKKLQAQRNQLERQYLETAGGDEAAHKQLYLQLMQVNTQIVELQGRIEMLSPDEPAEEEAPTESGQPQPKADAVCKADLVCSIQQGKQGGGELLRLQFRQSALHFFLVDRVGVEVQALLVGLIVVEFFQFQFQVYHHTKRIDSIYILLVWLSRGNLCFKKKNMACA